jgi:tetratricopeptide (TPR) repeat protein
MFSVCLLIIVYLLLFPPKHQPLANIYPSNTLTPGLFEMQVRIDRLIKNEEIIKGYALFKQRRFEEAKETLYNLLNTIHNNDKKFLFFILGEIEFDQKHFDWALKFYLQALEIDQDFFEANVKVGITYSRLKNYEKALSILKKVCSIDPDSFIVNFEIGKVYLETYKYDNALKHIEASLKIANDIRALFYKGLCLHRIGKNNEAIKIFETIAKTETEIQYRRNAIFIIYKHFFDRKEYTKALVYLNLWKKIEPQNDVIYFETGKVFYLLEKYNDAYNFFQDAFERQPNNNEILIFLAMCEIALKKYDFALQSIRRYLKTNETDTRAFRLAGDAYFGQKEYERSLENYNRYLKQTPNEQLDKEIYLRIARIYDGMEKYDDAITYLNKCKEISGLSKKDIYFNLAVVYDHKGEYQNALHYLMETLKITNDKESVRSYIGDIYVKQRKFSDAIDFYERVLKNSPESSISAYKIGNAYFLEGSLSRSRPYFNRILENKHLEGQNKSIISLAYMRLGDIEQIEQNYLKAVNYYLDSVKTDEKNSIAKINVAKMYIYTLQFKKAEELLKQLLTTEIVSKNRSDVYYLMASLRFKEGLKERSIDYLKQALKLDPMNENARLLLSNINK